MHLDLITISLGVIVIIAAILIRTILKPRIKTQTAPTPPVAVAPQLAHEDKPYTFELAYLCIYYQTVDEAVQNLSRLFIHRQMGLDQGPAAWVGILNMQLSPPDKLERLNKLGANFTPTQWRLILEQVRAALLACPEVADKPPPAFP